MTARLLLIRHAQASFGTDDYDRLSERGLRQAELLAQWLAAQPQLEFAHVVAGAQKRHAQTLHALQLAAAAVDRPLPAHSIDADWNEFDHESLLRGYASIALDDPDLPSLRDGLEPARVQALIGRAFAAWDQGRLDEHMPETLQTFRDRVRRAHDRAEARAAGGTTLVVSSGGVIARCAQALLALDEATTIRHNLSLANSGIVEFVRNDSEWQLQHWSHLPHLQDEQHRALHSWY
ncbi:broad specificity phosphatase PhoE [Tahibacter aquaticus]|uniref:Broad specificity phosphatase PhoE n=1 Tax=Tahibacter aquaticus TaxID=520092 RepID=A0A4R6YTH2_9GAMM|nr:histidine phosphatase family protein [Tahibacter aquaticus]TDR41638.1 broad specificity phosphatase PhoE [Tahibacter aquaticus]